jgi:hypothetical protein
MDFELSCDNNNPSSFQASEWHKVFVNFLIGSNSSDASSAVRHKFSSDFIFHLPFLICYLSLIECYATAMKNEIWKIENGK